MNPYLVIVTTIVGFIGQIFILKYLLVKKIRINNQQFKIFYEASKNSRKIVLNEELMIEEGVPPNLLTILFYIKNIGLCYIEKTERQNNAGWDATTPTCDLWVFRWDYHKICQFVKDSYISVEKVDVFINTNYLGDIIINKNKKIREIFKPIEKDFILIDKGVINTTSALLHGLPGNGKTTLIRDIASKYGWNIKYFDLNADTQNYNILSAATLVPDKTIILFEDFDSVFDNRKLTKFENNTNIKFSFDAILNLLDGLYKGKKKIAFFMTCNDINKIDTSIKNRRSRMKHNILVDNPTFDDINNVINDEEISYLMLGKSLDNVFDIKGYLEINGRDKTIERLKREFNLLASFEKTIEEETQMSIEYEEQ